MTEQAHNLPMEQTVEANDCSDLGMLRLIRGIMAGCDAFGLPEDEYRAMNLFMTTSLGLQNGWLSIKRLRNPYDLARRVPTDRPRLG